MLNKRAGEVLLQVGRQIRAMREGAGMTQAELARKLRLREEAVFRSEKGLYNMRMRLLFKIAKIFGRRLKFRVINRR